MKLKVLHHVRNSQIQDQSIWTELNLDHRVAGLSLREKVRSSIIPEEEEGGRVEPLHLIIFDNEFIVIIDAI